MKTKSWEAPRKFRFDVQDNQFCKSKDTPPIYFAKCVAVAVTNEGVAVRDTKDESKNTLYFTRNEWDAFLKGAKRGEFDLK